MKNIIKHNLTVTLVFVCCAVLFSLMTVFVQVRALGRTYLEGEQLRRHTAVIRGTAKSPYQYRVLVEYLLEGGICLLTNIGSPHPAIYTFIGFRVFQNILLFLFAALYYKSLGLRTYHVLLGMSLLAWGMTHALYNSDLAFNTYFDVVFYLSAGLVILYKKDLWIIPITALAALNRETSGLIPFMLLAAHYRDLRQKFHQAKGVVLITASAFILYLVIFTSLRYIFGPQPFSIPEGQHHPGLEIFVYNIGRYITWGQLFATLGLLPVLAILSSRRWPFVLKMFFGTIVPFWFLIHLFGSAIAETRLFLVPFALIFVPGALFGIVER
jgi:hypothetical protein